MPNRSAPPAGSRYTGLWRDMVNGTIELYSNGTLVQAFSASTPSAVTGAFTATTTITAGTGITATTGSITSTAGSFVAPVGNVSMGTPGAFATTQPQAAVVMGGSSLTGIAPVGAITTAGAVFASDTVVRKIIAAGTASNVET